MYHNIRPTISRDHRWEEGNDGLVNTSTLAWTYTGDVEEKGEQEDWVKRQFLKEIKKTLTIKMEIQSTTKNWWDRALDLHRIYI